MLKYQPGFKFMSTNTDYEIITFLERHNMYLLNNITDNRQDELMDESQIEYYLSNKEEFAARRESNRIFLLEQEKREKAREEKERLEQEKYNFCHGFTDNLTAMQKGKILTVLNKKLNYTDTGKSIGFMTRKEFIYNKLLENALPKMETNINHYDKRTGENKIKDKEYRLYTDKSSFYEITKIEYDYALYLLDKVIRTA